MYKKPWSLTLITINAAKSLLDWNLHTSKPERRSEVANFELLRQYSTSFRLFPIPNLYRSSRPQVFCKKGILKNFTKFTGKHLWQSLFFDKVAGLRTATLFKERLWHKCFPVNFVKFLRTSIFIEHLWWLFLLLINQHRRPVLKPVCNVCFAYCFVISNKGNNNFFNHCGFSLALSYSPLKATAWSLSDK